MGHPPSEASATAEARFLKLFIQKMLGYPKGRNLVKMRAQLVITLRMWMQAA